MSVSIGRIGLLFLTIFGILAIVVPEYMPSVKEPYDKVLHFGVFGTATLFAVLSVASTKAALSLASIIVLLGLFVEIAQSFMPGRSADMADAGANALGAVIVLVFYFMLKKSDSENETILLKKNVIDAYRNEKDAGRPNVECLNVAAEAYRSLRPEIDEQEIRINIIKWVESKG